MYRTWLEGTENGGRVRRRRGGGRGNAGSQDVRVCAGMDLWSFDCDLVFEALLCIQWGGLVCYRPRGRCMVHRKV